MNIRLLLLIPFTLFSLVMALMLSLFSEGFPWILSGFTLVGIYGIYSVIRFHVKFKLADPYLVYDSMLNSAQQVDLRTLNEWKELTYNIRGQQRKTLILLFNNDHKVVVDNSEYKEEFEELAMYLTNKADKLGGDFVMVAN